MLVDVELFERIDGGCGHVGDFDYVVVYHTAQRGATPSQVAKQAGVGIDQVGVSSEGFFRAEDPMTVVARVLFYLRR